METDVVIYEPVSDRVAFVAELAKRWVRPLVSTTSGESL